MDSLGGADGPAQFGGSGTGVGVALFGGGPHNFSRDVAVEAAAQPGLKRFLYSSIFAGMKSENDRSSAGLQRLRQGAQERFQRGKFVVHSDSQRLKDAANGRLLFVFMQMTQTVADGRRQCGRRAEGFPRKNRGEHGGMRFVRVLLECRYQ